MTTKAKSIGGLILLLAAFLAGFVPQYLENARLRSELLAGGEQAVSLETALRMAEVRDLCGMIVLEVQQQNYGLAREHSTQYFEKLRLAVEDTQNPRRQPLGELLASRDSITTLLAQNDPGLSSEMQILCRRTYEITKR